MHEILIVVRESVRIGRDARVSRRMRELTGMSRLSTMFNTPGMNIKSPLGDNLDFYNMTM